MTGRRRSGPGRIALAGAQTGGHLLPAVETAAVLVRMGFEVTLVTSGQAVEKEILKNAGIPVRALSVGRIKTMGIGGRVRGLLSIPGSMMRAAALVKELNPDVACGFGGFTSGPFVMAASLMGVPTAVFEANSIPGMTNRLLARRARRVFISFDSAAARLGRSDCEMTGTPVRAAILDVNRPEATSSGRRLLVVGGSQGSRFLNVNIPLMAAVLKDHVAGLEVRHQCGIGNSNAVNDAYIAAGVNATVSDYVQDMADAYGWADFIVCRSGAGTVSEVAAVGLPAMFVPFAAAADDHQAYNAMDLAAAGAALMVRESEFDAGRAASDIAAIMNDRAKLNAMSSAARKAGRRDAAERIASALAELVKI